MKTFASIYRQYFDFVWASARRLGVEPAAVDDVVHDVFLVVHGRLHTLEKPEALRSWIYGIVRRTASDHRRAQRVRLASGPKLASAAEASCAATPADVAAQNEKVQLLYSLLEELDVPKREIFMMVEIDELTVPEAAGILEVPVNTAYTRLRAARQAFEKALARHEAQYARRGELCRA